MSERLTDEQIETVEQNCVVWVPGYGMSSRIRQAFADLRHYKQLAEERGKALEFYADLGNYFAASLGRVSETDADKGERARKALGKEQNP
jgi:hypothetical protein